MAMEIDEMSDELNIRIKADNSDAVFVSEFDDGVWISLQVRGGSAHTVLTRAQAEDLAEAINKILAAQA